MGGKVAKLAIFVVLFALEGTKLDNPMGDMRHKFVISDKFTP
jgi:hypothetical protein